MISIAPYDGKNVAVQLSVKIHLSFDMGGRPVPLLVKRGADGKTEISTDPSDPSSVTMSVDMIVGKVVKCGDFASVRIDDPVNKGCTMDIRVAEEVIVSVTTVGEKKSHLSLIS